MIEIINGFLLTYFVILCTLSAFVPRLVKPLAACFNKPSGEEREAWKELSQLKDEQGKTSLKEEFAAYSKIQRKINKVEEQLKESSKIRISKHIAIKGAVHLVLQGLFGLIMVFSMIWFRREPLVVLKGNLFPLATILTYPSEVPNAISTHIWVLISNYSIRLLIKPLS